MMLHRLLISSLLVFAAGAHAADEEAESLLASMREAYKSVKTAKFSTTTTIFDEGKELTATFEASFKGPEKLYLYADGMFGVDGKFKVVCDGKTVVVTTPDEKAELPFSLEELSSAAPVNLESMCFWDWKRQLSTSDDGNMKKSAFKILKEQDWNAKKWTVLEETANEQEVFARYWIDPKSKMIWKTEVFELESRTKIMTCELKKLETGIEIADSVFDN